MGLPFVAMGLLYRQGYFQQSLDAEGNQHAVYNDSHFSDLPIKPVVVDGHELEVTVEFGNRDVHVKVWEAKVGRVMLYLLDTDLAANRPDERATAHRLYGGDRDTRIKQEIVLGIGGVRALSAMGIKPTVWHINEGHARSSSSSARASSSCRAWIRRPPSRPWPRTPSSRPTRRSPPGTTISPRRWWWATSSAYARELKVSLELLLALGRTGEKSDFNMTGARGERLALPERREQDPRARVGGAAARPLAADSPSDESPIGSVTNGVHVESFLAPNGPSTSTAS
jgi:starch phosphorylase